MLNPKISLKTHLEIKLDEKDWNKRKTGAKSFSIKESRSKECGANNSKIRPSSKDSKDSRIKCAFNKSVGLTTKK